MYGECVKIIYKKYVKLESVIFYIMRIYWY